MILEKVIDHAVDTPNHVAIVDDKRTLTYRELVYGSNLFVDHLNTLAPREQFGDMVGLLIPPTAAFVVAFGGARWADRIPLPLNYLLKPEELAAIVKDSGLKVLFTIEFLKPLAESIAALVAKNGNGTFKVITMESLTFEKPGLAAMAAIAMNPANLRKYLKPLPLRKPDDVAAIMYTSGTSGVPKGVMLTNQNLESNAIDSCRHAHFTEKTVFLGVLPMFHTLGLMGCMLIPMMLGSKVVCQARFSPMGTFEAVQHHAVEVLVMVPSMYAVLANAKAAKSELLQSVRIAVSGGEPLPVTLIEQFRQKFNITLMEGFGLTETSPIVALNVPWAYKLGSTGRLIPNVQVKTVDDSGHDLPVNADGGELYIKGPNVMKGYYHKPDLSAEVLTADGWFKTGDIARIDADGYLYITGRKKDMIIMAGEKIFPREIEDALKQHPAVLLAGVIGVKDEQRGEVPIAFIQLKPEACPTGQPPAQPGVPSPGQPPAQPGVHANQSAPSSPTIPTPTESELRAFVRERIAPYKTPRNIYILDELPLTPTGKILKRALKIPA